MERFMILGGSSGPRSIGPSMYIYDSSRYRVVIDSGSEFLSRDKVRGGNFEALKDGRMIDAVILTHGHLDHIAFVPALEPFLRPDAKIFASSGDPGSCLLTSPSIEGCSGVLFKSRRFADNADSVTYPALGRRFRQKCEPIC